MPTWIGGSGALAAAWYAFQTITSQRQQIGEQREFIAEQTRFMAEQQLNLQLERAELRAAADDRKWAQARQVEMLKRQFGSDNDGYTWAVTVQNPTDAILHQVEVRFGSSNLAARAVEWPAFDDPPPGVRALPGDTLTIPVDVQAARAAVRFYSPRWPRAVAHNNRPTLFFTDDGGVRWSLNSYGKLEETPDNAS
ncbi:hypothetical protein F3K39_19125 [Streptomyces sp. LBUM 1479]|uniref:hypothetical protein n=1 Tax=Streptomyces scabiei TaxID=1930 RepID=UPI001B310BA4|nr:hypothetical protein [Streptomyces sp. LBUM 1475]MBP5930180.1 hypothetical protein [Streptomyces sp. LBUM 1479]QTU63135.1 hypothetical protein F3K22_20825 [Streptomyces sp. LBUM 1475]